MHSLKWEAGMESLKSRAKMVLVSKFLAQSSIRGCANRKDELMGVVVHTFNTSS